MTTQTGKRGRPARVEAEATGLNSQNRSPLYHQIYLILRARILDGEYQPGDYLPGERELEGLFQVSRITAVRALNDLASQGLVVRERGRGTRVQMFVGSGIVARGPTGVAEKSPSRVRGGSNDELEALHRNGRAQVTLCDFDYVEANASVAEALGMAQGDLVQHAIRVWRFKDARPFNYVQTYVPEDIGRRWTRADMEKQALQRLFVQHGIEIALVQEQITATLADMLLSRQLEVEAGSPILKIRRIAYDTDGRPVEFLTGYYPPDRYQYEVTLPRKPATGSE